MRWLNDVTDESKNEVLRSIAFYWSDLQFESELLLKEFYSAEVPISIASCKAVGGNPNKVIKIVAGLISFLQTARILDDLQDKDKPNALWLKIGQGRALNFAFAFYTLSFRMLGELIPQGIVYKKIYDTYLDGISVALAGQERDLLNKNRTWQDYWHSAEMKTSFIVSTAAAMGAIAGTSNEKHINACKIYGYHMGLTLQILNDMEGVWEPEGISDIEQGKVTLPVLYGMNCQHMEQKELQMIVWQGRLAEKAQRVKAILDNIDTKSYLIWAALEQRKKALEAIQICPDEEGKNALTYFLNGMFGDIDELLANPHIAAIKPQEEKPVFDFNARVTFNPPPIPKKEKPLTSTALDIRRSLRFTEN